MSRRKNSKHQEGEWISELNPADVLFGRGSGPNDHEGNVVFRSMVAQRKNEYLSTTHRQTKAKIAREIVDNVWSRGGRFLKRVDGGVDAWCVVDEETTMEKAKQALRQNRGEKAPTAAAAPPALPSKKAVSVTPTTSGNFTGAAAVAGVGAAAAQVPAKVPSPVQMPPPVHHQQPKVVSAPPAVGRCPIPPMAGYSSAHAAASLPTNPALPIDPFEPIPVEQMTQPTRIPSGLMVWADFAATHPPGSMSSSADQIPYPSPQQSQAGVIQGELSERERRESLQIADLVRSDPLQQGGFFDDFRKTENSADMQDLVEGVLRLSTRTMDEEAQDSNTTMGTIERPSGTAQRGSSSSTKASHMSGISMEGSDSSLFDTVRCMPSAAAISDKLQQEVYSMRRDSSDSSAAAAAAAASATSNTRRSSGKAQLVSDTSLSLSDVWRRESLFGNKPMTPEEIIQEGDENASSPTMEGVAPRRLSQLQKDPDMLEHFGSSSMSVLKTALAKSGDSAMMFPKGKLSESLDDNGET